MSFLIKVMSIVLVFFCTINSLAKKTDPLEKALDFTQWLEKHAKDFGKCQIETEGHNYKLCDGTLISNKELKNLFAMKPDALLKDIKAKGINVEILCDATKGEVDYFKAFCSKNLKRKEFEKVTSFHGMYLPEDHTILIRSSATPGSFIHEYIHSLQAKNKNQMYGKNYKSERIEIQKQLIEYMDKEIAAVNELEKQNNKAALSERIKKFQIASELMMNFGNWQDLIDERGIFLLYIQFGKDFGVDKKDRELAKMNMRYICKNKKLRPLLLDTQCAI